MWNDPVNNRFGAKDAALLAHTEEGARVVYSTDILLAYPSPLPVAKYPDYSGSNLYQAAELFNSYVSRAALEDSRLVTVPADISWTRVGPCLPWLQMGSRPGQLIYQIKQLVAGRCRHGAGGRPPRARAPRSSAHARTAGARAPARA